MMFFNLVVLGTFTFVRVCGNPMESSGEVGSGRYLWNVVGSHYAGENLEENSVKDSDQIPKPRLSKRADRSESLGDSALGTIGKLMNIVNSNLNLNIKTEAACKPCKTGIQMMKVFIGLSKKDEDIIQLGIQLCIQLKIMTEEVCDGLVRINGPAIVHVLKNTEMTPVEICSFLMKTDCDNVKSSHHEWKVEIPDLKLEERTAQPEEKNIIDYEAPKLKVLHISDTHFDPHYVEGTWAECSLPLCCREAFGKPAENGTKSGPWGGWKCDIPEKTLDNALEHINKQHPDIDYVLWTGDVPPHDMWSLYRNESLDILNATLSKMRKHFPNVPVFPALGNHETVPANLFPPSGVAGEEWDVQWLYDEIEKEWSQWLGKNSSETIRLGAFYTTKIRQDLRIVSLNTNYCYYNNWWLILNSTDPMEELKWLIEVLEEAERQEEKVHIIGHIPVGHEDCLKIWQENYYSIIKRFNSTVVAQFFGHTHRDEFELFYDNNDLDHPFGLAYVGPSITTYTYLNPGYRIYYVDGDHKRTTRLVTDHETWVMDLETANEEGNPVWSKLYSAREAYNMTSLTPQDWHKVFQEMFQNEEFFDLYYKHYWKDSPRRTTCGKGCRENLYCGIRSCDQYGPPTVNL